MSYPSRRGSKVGLTGRKGSAGHPLPAWKNNAYNTYQNHVNSSNAGPSTHHAHGTSARAQLPPEGGSKIYIQELPVDVTQVDVHDLLSETVGPLQEVYIVHSSQGLPKGCAFAHFQRAQDAAVACKKYHGTHIDGGKKSLRVQIIQEYNSISDPASQPASRPKSLAERLNPINASSKSSNTPPNPLLAHAPTQYPRRPPPTAPAAITRPNRPKKGPRRAKKQENGHAPMFQVKTVQDLDADMESYRSAGIGGLGLAIA